ncbi:MAG: hypothetical protein KJ063_07290 [Anaerolineae bacterium]|nr:hypothetical protein [Anaerolineae bacterium]
MIRNWLNHLFTSYWRTVGVIAIVLLLNFLLVTRVVGLAYDNFSWAAFIQTYDPYEDNDNENDNENENDNGNDNTAPEPYQEIILPTATTEVYTILDLPTATPLPTARPLTTPTPGPSLDELYGDLAIPGTTEESPADTPPSGGFMRGPGFLGTGASMGADIALVGESILYFFILAGIAVQLMRLWKAHDWIMTFVVVGNFFLIGLIMIGSFRGLLRFIGSGNAEISPSLLLPLVHAVIGLLAQFVAIYCMLAGHKILPRKIGTLRYFMWLTFILWTMAYVLGVGTYIAYYGGRSQATEEIPAVVDATDVPPDAPLRPQRVLLQNFTFSPATLTVLAGTTINWVNQDIAPHNVTFADGQAASNDFGQAGSFNFTLTEPGDYIIYCTLHGNPGNGMSSTITVVERSEEAAIQILAQPTPNVVPAVPTPAPTVPPPPVALIEPPSPEAQVVGLVAFYDQSQSSDSVVVTLNGLSAPPPGFVYVGWLINNLTQQVWNIGVLPVSSSGVVIYNHTHPLGENLLAQYDGFQITLEQGDGQVNVPGVVVYSGRQPRQATELIRRMAVAAATPTGEGYANSARAQTEELIRHVEYVQIALDLLSIADAQRHSEHIFNILVGAAGARDLDGAHGIQNPGDTFGVIPYLENLRATAQATMNAPDATNAIRIHSTHVEMSTTNALAWAAEIQQAALNIGAANSVAAIANDVATLQRYSTLLLWGEDNNGDGVIDPGEGGIFTAYQHAQYTGAIGVVAGDAAAVVDPEPVGNALVVATESGELVIEMRDFANSPANVVITAGTIVRFINTGQALHSATADDGFFDTGLIGSGQSQAFTFGEVGSYSYFCSLHGLPGGVGMAGTIEVTSP